MLAPLRLLVNRVFLVIALLAIVVGLFLGQSFITWLNATVLCLSCIGIQ
ncbi:MAG: hypothetical protein ACUVR2_09820 [Anaerolineae bacterium]